MELIGIECNGVLNAFEIVVLYSATFSIPPYPVLFNGSETIGPSILSYPMLCFSSDSSHQYHASACMSVCLPSFRSIELVTQSVQSYPSLYLFTCSHVNKHPRVKSCGMQWYYTHHLPFICHFTIECRVNLCLVMSSEIFQTVQTLGRWTDKCCTTREHHYAAPSVRNRLHI